MTRRTFLPIEIFWSIVGIWIYTLMHASFGYQLLITILSFVVLFLGRKSSVPYRDTLKNDGEIYLSPVSGEVKSIRKNVQLADYPHLKNEIRMTVNFWSEKGLYLPTSGEVAYLKAMKGRRISREAQAQAFYGPVDELAHTDFLLTSKNSTKTLLRFIDCQYGNRPTIWLKSGDRGRGAACFGYYPFGGTLLIYLPENSDILVFENEKVVPGHTVVAAIKE
jgi:hypothetical protein